MPCGRSTHRAMHLRKPRMLRMSSSGNRNREGGARGYGARAGRGPLQGEVRCGRRQDYSRRRVAHAGTLDRIVTVVEFADFECPFCQQMAPLLDALWEKRKTAVAFVFKFMPLAMHPHGEIAARAAIAADRQGKFWEMNRRLFGAGTRLDEKDLDSYASELNLDMDRFHNDMRSEATGQRLAKDRKLADELGVKGTPTLFIDGREYETKLDLEEWIDSEIAAAAKSPESPR